VDEWIESIPTETNLGVLVDEKLDRSWPCVLAVQKTNCILHQKKRGQQVKEGDSATLLHSGETPPGVLHPALEPPCSGLVAAGNKSATPPPLPPPGCGGEWKETGRNW